MEQLANAITFYAFFVASKVAKTGITVTIDVWELTQAGGATEIVTAGSATEVGDGIYKYVLASGSVDAVGEYIAVFKTADATVDQQHIPALWIVGRAGNENLDATVSSRNATTPPTAAANATAVRSELTTELGRIDTAVSSRNATTPLDATATQAAAAAALNAYDPPTATEMNERTLPSADYVIVSDLPAAPDNASIAAILEDTGTTLDALIKDVPTVAELSSAFASADDATLAAIAALNNLSSAQAQSAAAAALTAYDPLLNPVPGDYASGTAGAVLGSLAGASVTVVSPVAADGTTIDLIFGDDYYAADGRALLFNAEGATLTGNLVYLRVRNNVGAVAIAGVVTGAHTCYFEVTSAQLSSIGIGEWRYDFEYILPTTHVITVLHDRIMRVKQDAR